MSVLILTRRFDLTADAVIRELNDLGVSLHRIDTADFPQDARLEAITCGSDSWTGALHTADRTVNLTSIHSIWYRRPSKFRPDGDLPASAQAFAYRETRAALGGLLRSLDCLWVNHPEHSVSAGYKPTQLSMARKHQLRVPDSLITNDPERALKFWRENRSSGVVYKVLSNALLDDNSGNSLVVYTQTVEEEHLNEIERVSDAPCLFQELIEKRFDIRITVVGDSVFYAKIEGGPRGPIDWRSAYEDVSYEEFNLPDDIERSCVLLTKEFGLRFSAIDMAVSTQGEFVFFELNPNGQWLWIERETGLPISRVLADLLAKGGR